MTRAEFRNPVAKVEAALQGHFEDHFIDFLWERWQNTDLALWKRACSMLALGMKPARLLVAKDFSSVLLLAREELGRERKAVESRNFPRSSSTGTGSVRPIHEIARETYEKTKNPWIRRLVSDLATAAAKKENGIGTADKKAETESV